MMLYRDRTQDVLNLRKGNRTGVLAAVCILVLLCGNLAAQDVVQELDAPINPQSGIPCPSPDQYSLLRPDPQGVPTTVGLGLFLQDISALDDVEQTMTADVYVVVRWKDQRLADPARGEGSADCPVPSGTLWLPSIEPENLRSRDVFYSPRFLVNAQGVITYIQRQLVQASYPLDFRNFPLDHHLWKFTLWPTLSKTDEIRFHSLDNAIRRNESISLQGWTVGDPFGEVSEGERSGRVGQYARLDVVVDLERDWGYYAWKLGLPLTLIVLMAYCVYYIPSSATAQQIGVGMTSMLTLIAYMLALGSSLPKIAYLTRADRFFVGSAVLVFFGLLKGVLAAAWQQDRGSKAVDRLDRLGRWLFPVAMLANFLIALVW